MADLTKFGVPMPGGIRNGILQPKQDYRFRVLLKGFGTGQFLRELTQNVMECDRPTFKDDVIKLSAYNSTAYIRGKHEWESIKIKFRDDITNAVTSAVGSQIQKQINHFEQTSSVAGINYKFDMEIHALDGTNGDELESWELNGCFIANTAYSGGKYESGEVQTIEVEVRYDNATLLRGPGGDGITVGTDPYPNNPSLVGGTRA